MNDEILDLYAQIGALTYGCNQALALLKNGDAKPDDANRVTKLIKTIFKGTTKMIEPNTELFALRYACYRALDLLLDADAEPADADAVIKLIENALNWKPL